MGSIYNFNIYNLMSKLYYHILEHHGYGNIGYQGYYNTLEEAQRNLEILRAFFPNLHYTIWQDTSKKEPPIVTL